MKGFLTKLKRGCLSCAVHIQRFRWKLLFSIWGNAFNHLRNVQIEAKWRISPLCGFWYKILLLLRLKCCGLYSRIRRAPCLICVKSICIMIRDAKVILMVCLSRRLAEIKGCEREWRKVGYKFMHLSLTLCGVLDAIFRGIFLLCWSLRYKDSGISFIWTLIVKVLSLLHRHCSTITHQ